MTSRDFVYWLQGFFEITGPTALTEKQALTVRQHLNLVFAHEIDPSMGDKNHQDKLNKVHADKLGPMPMHDSQDPLFSNQKYR